MRYIALRLMLVVMLLSLAATGRAGVGDVQLKTDHPWYPGELSCSTFPRLAKTQAEAYARVTGKQVASEEDKVLASWFWRNTHYYHSTEASSDLWGKGLGKGTDTVSREYWKGLFADGYSLCYTTHAQWEGEMQALLGPGRSRACEVDGHTSFEVYLKGGAYGDGRWALLDHDISTVYFTPDGKRLMSLAEVSKDLTNLKRRTARQNHGWLPGGLHPSDPETYATYKSADYSYGYATLPPMVHLRSGESIRRYIVPGLEDGKTFVFWGINYHIGNIPGPHRDRTWVNQPEKMYQATRDAGSRLGQWYGNAVYTYRPDFAGGKYKEAAIDDTPEHVTLEFATPYVIGCTPPNLAAEKDVHAVYQSGGKNGLVIHGTMTCPVSVSADQGKTWTEIPSAHDGMDLTDSVKGRQQYWLRLHAPAKELADKQVVIRTVCQSSISIVPRVHEGTNQVTYCPGGLAAVSAGPDMNQVLAHVVEGTLGTNKAVTLELCPPRGESSVHLYAAQRQMSGSPPTEARYNIDCSTDGGQTWIPVVKDRPVIRHVPEPADFWSQSHTWGDLTLSDVAGPLRVRFRAGGRTLQRCEAHLAYKVENTSPLRATFAWKESGQVKQASHTFGATKPGVEDNSWSFQSGPQPTTLWVEYLAE